MAKGLTLRTVTVRGPRLSSLTYTHEKVTYRCERSSSKGIYMLFDRPSYRNGVTPPARTPGMSITLLPGLPFSKKVGAGFCGAKIDAMVDELNGHSRDDYALVIDVLTPLLRGEVAAFRLT